MNLLFCCENYFPSIGGVQEVIRQIAERLVAKGHVVSVATSTHNARPLDINMSGVRVVSFPISGGLVKGIDGQVGGYIDFVINGDFDAVIIKAAQQWSFDVLTPVLNLIKARKVFIPCGFSGFYQSAYLDYYQQMASWMASFDALIFYATDYRDIIFAREHGLTGIEIVPNGADEREFNRTSAPEFRKEMGIKSDDLLFLTVGSINGEKGHWEVAKAFELAKLPRSATLILNGNYPLRTKKGLAWQFIRESAQGRIPLNILVNRINARQGSGKRVILVDLPREDLVKAFKSSDLFVFASYVEYSPLVLFEAIASGTPFISMAAGNAEEIVKWTNGGVICPTTYKINGKVRSNPIGLAREIEMLIANPQQLSNFGLAGRHAFIEGGFSWSTITNRYEEIICKKN